MNFLPDSAGPQNPLPTSPVREPGSIRRTTTIDTRRDGLADPGHTTLHGRDLFTDLDGEAHVLDDLVLTADVASMTRELLEISSPRATEQVATLRGAGVGSGFRAKVQQAIPDRTTTGDLIYQLLDDLSGASLVSGYSRQRQGFEVTGAQGRVPTDVMERNADICAGWASDATILTAFRVDNLIPIPLGPPSPALPRPDDPLGWHALPELEPQGMRRARRLDVLAAQPDGSHPFNAHFRDLYQHADGHDLVLHEYTVTGSVDPVSRRIMKVHAQARVLPWLECPAAVASAIRLEGHGIDDLRSHVREDFVGTSTCTHLNDTLRSLTDLGPLLDALTGGLVGTG
jgi:hypothetical protein